ncbi:hypothetical protein IAR50_001281 [Cryptococcus sp. DSM 104548]
MTAPYQTHSRESVRNHLTSMTTICNPTLFLNHCWGVMKALLTGLWLMVYLNYLVIAMMVKYRLTIYDYLLGQFGSKASVGHPPRQQDPAKFQLWQNPNVNVTVSYKDFRRVVTPYESWENKKVVFNRRCTGQVARKQVLKSKWGETEEIVKKPHAYHEDGEPCWDPECPEFDANLLVEDYLKEKDSFFRSFQGALKPLKVRCEPVRVEPTRRRFFQHPLVVRSNIPASKLKARWRIYRRRREEARRMAKLEKSWAWEWSEIARLKKDHADQKAEADAAKEQRLIQALCGPPLLPLMLMPDPTQPGASTLPEVEVPPLNPLAPSSSVTTLANPSTAPSSVPSTGSTTPALSRDSSITSISTLFSETPVADLWKDKASSLSRVSSSASLSETVQKVRVRFAREKKPAEALGLFESIRARREYTELHAPSKPARIDWEERGLPEKKWWKRD